jgi:nucleotide-binding universal stress UspA family protein
MSDDDPQSPGAGDSLSIRRPPKVLLPVEILEGQSIPESLVRFLAPSEIVVLGYHVVPEQTPTEQASMQFEQRAREAVEDIAHTFESEGRTVETRVAFTHDGDATVERVASDVDATAVLLPNPSTAIAEVLVPLRGAIDEERLADLVATLLEEGETNITLWGIGSQDEDAANRERLERTRQTLLDRGVPESRIRTELDTVAAPLRAIIDRSAEFDLIVMGEGRNTLLTSVLGDETERIADGAVAPVLVVRRRNDE